MKPAFTWKNVLILTVLLNTNVIAQQPFFQNIGINQGLPSTETYDVFQDSRGYIWIGTDAGVCRFNGRTFRCFTTADGLVDNTIFNIEEDSRGRVWFTGFNCRIGYYDNGRFYEIEASTGIQELLGKGKYPIHQAFFDNHDNLWLATTRSFYQIPAAGAYKTILEDKPCADSVLLTLRLLSGGKAMMSAININPGSVPGNTRFSICARGWPKQFVYNKRSTFFSPRHDALLLDGKTLVFSVDNFLVFLGKNGTWKSREFPGCIISLMQDREGNIWVGLSKGGVHFFEKGNFKKEPLVYLDDLSVSSVITDHENGLWLSTLEKGVFYAPYREVFGLADEPGLNEKIAGVGKVYGKIYAANYKSEYFIIDGSQKVVKLAHINRGISYTIDRTSFFPANGKVLFSGGLMVTYDTVKRAFDKVFKDNGVYFSTKEAIVLPDGRIAGIAFAWFLLFDNGKLQKKELPGRGTAIFRARNGKVYIGTINGLYTWNGEDFIPERWVKILKEERISDIAEDSAGRLLVATRGKGLIVIGDRTWTSINTGDGISSDICNQVMTDRDTVWLATTKGVSFFRLDSLCRPYGMKNIDVSNGLPTNEVVSLAKLGNYLYVGTRNGLSAIHVKGTFYNRVPAPLYVSSLRVNGRSLDPNVVHRLSHNQNNISFSVDCLTFKRGFSPQYRYRLMGLSDRFVQSDRDTIEFLNLSPGRYSLEIHSVNSGGTGWGQKVVISFIIGKPFWQTWWFIVSCSVVFITLVLLFLRWRIYRIRKRERLKNKMDKMMAEYQMIALRAQMNPHFIFNAINSIQNLILKEKAQQAYDYLTKFSKMVRKVLNYSGENMLTLEQEIEILRLYVELEQFRFNHAFDFDLDVDPLIDRTEAMVPGMFLQPFVENAIWHGILPLEGERHGKIQVRIRVQTDHLVITIEDNGIGRQRSGQISKSVSHKSMGLKLSDTRMKLVERLYGTSGSKITFEDLYDIEDQPAGTRVVISIIHMTAE